MRPLIAGNWKLHGLRADLRQLELLAAWAQKVRPEIDVLVCPPATLIRDAARMAEGRLEIGGQDCPPDVSG
jgi:triosephosphate isomerase